MSAAQPVARILFPKSSKLLSRSVGDVHRHFSSFQARYSTASHESPFLESPYVVEEHGNRVTLYSEHHDDIELAAPWLWSNDPRWMHRPSGQRLKSPADYPGSKIVNARLISSEDLDCEGVFVLPPKGSFHAGGGVYESPENRDEEYINWVLELEWEDSNKPTHFLVSWLLERALPRSSPQISPQHALHRSHQLFEVEYDYLFQDQTILLNLYTSIFQHGAAIVRNCPTLFENNDTTPSAVVGNLLAGSLSHGSLYGDVFHVQAVPLAHNLAYTTAGLPPHQDLAYYESPPGLQLLHCVSHEGVSGGESTLADGMAAAHYLRQVAPGLFDILTKTDATFCKQREGADMVAYYPHIQLCNDREIVGINWSPPFEGPLRNTSAEVIDYYAAYAAFARLVDKDLPQDHFALSPELCHLLREYAEEHTFETLLQEGDMLVFNNRRMLHGRKPFQLSQQGSRHLVGVYTNMDETLNKYRLLMRQFGCDETVLNVGNGTSAAT